MVTKRNEYENKTSPLEARQMEMHTPKHLQKTEIK